MDQFSEHIKITRDLALWSVHDAKNATRQSPRRLSCVGDKLLFSEKLMCKYISVVLTLPYKQLLSSRNRGHRRKDPECSTTKDNKLALSLKIMCYLPWNLI